MDCIGSLDRDSFHKCCIFLGNQDNLGCLRGWEKEESRREVFSLRAFSLLMPTASISRAAFDSIRSCFHHDCCILTDFVTSISPIQYRRQRIVAAIDIEYAILPYVAFCYSVELILIETEHRGIAEASPPKQFHLECWPVPVVYLPSHLCRTQPAFIYDG